MLQSTIFKPYFGPTSEFDFDIDSFLPLPVSLILNSNVCV